MAEEVAKVALFRVAELLGKSTDGLEDFAKVAVEAKTHPTRVDRRFPNTNQINNCWTAFNEYQLCVDKRGKDDKLCLQRGRDYGTLCPQKYTELWKEQASAGKSMSVGKAFADEE